LCSLPSNRPPPPPPTLFPYTTLFRSPTVQEASGDRLPSTLVLEADLQLDSILHDLAALHGCGGLDDLHRPDIAHGFAGRGNCLAGRIAPGARARADHLADDDDAHQAPPAWSVRRRAAGRERQSRPLA